MVGGFGYPFTMCIKIGFHSYVVDDLSPNPSPARRGEPEILVPPSLVGKGVRGLGFFKMCSAWSDRTSGIKTRSHRCVFQLAVCFVMLSSQVCAVFIALTNVAFQAQCLKVFHIISAT